MTEQYGPRRADQKGWEKQIQANIPGRQLANKIDQSRPQNKMAVEVTDMKGSQNFEMEQFEWAWHSCGKLIVLDNQITIEVVTK